ncbi:MAG: leucine-rich repeat domain-containing protein [Myxococcota bacterium]|nr:leucine-rich repeat domain-containing protein [Myxococcota bacterium]
MWIYMFLSCSKPTILIEGDAESSGDPTPFINACEAQDASALLLKDAVKQASCQGAWDIISKAERIDITNVDISTLDIFSGMTNLKIFTAYENGIEDISPLRQLDRMEELYLVSNRITDISPLIHLRQLQVLRLDGNQIKDISILPKLKRLNRIGLDSNQIEDFTPIAELDAVQALNTNYNPVDPKRCPIDAEKPKQLKKYCKRMHKHYCKGWKEKNPTCEQPPDICIPYCEE